MSDIDQLAADNVADFMENGPGLRTSYNQWIVARDPRGHVLVGGLGGMGVGEMWFRESDHHREYPGYDEAEALTRPCEAWVPPDAPGGLRTCPEPLGHGGPHVVPEVIIPRVEWWDPQTSV